MNLFLNKKTDKRWVSARYLLIRGNNIYKHQTYFYGGAYIAITGIACHHKLH